MAEWDTESSRSIHFRHCWFSSSVLTSDLHITDGGMPQAHNYMHIAWILCIKLSKTECCWEIQCVGSYYIFALCSLIFASFAFMSLSNIGASRGIGSRHLSCAALFTSLSKKLMAASSSINSLRELFRNSISNWICWNPLLLKVWSRTNSCKLFRQSLRTVEITDSCVYSSLVNISIFCSNNFARWFSRNWLLLRFVFDRFNMSSRIGLLLEEVVLPVLSECRCRRIKPGKICLTSDTTPLNSRRSRSTNMLTSRGSLCFSQTGVENRLLRSLEIFWVFIFM